MIIFNKISSITKNVSVVTLMVMTIFAGTLFAAPSLSMAQQQQQATTGTATVTATTIPPLTPQEQQQQERLQGIMAATTRNLLQGQKQIDGLVYTPRWSNPIWVELDSLSIAFAYCLPGEFAESGQHILGGADLEVLESYVLAVTNDLTGWLIVIENENENARLPAAVGAICSSDANVVEARVLSPQEQIVINNIINQFTTVRNNITQIINIINNVTTNQTGGGTTTPPPTNDTGGGVTPEPLRAQVNLDSTDIPFTHRFEASADGGTPPYTYHWDFGDGQEANVQNTRHTYEDPGSYTATLTVTDSTGQTASDSTEVIVSPEPTTGEPTANQTGGQ
jgi:hypothetical protein